MWISIKNYSQIKIKVQVVERSHIQEGEENMHLYMILLYCSPPCYDEISPRKDFLLSCSPFFCECPYSKEMFVELNIKIVTISDFKKMV